MNKISEQTTDKFINEVFHAMLDKSRIYVWILRNRFGMSDEDITDFINTVGREHMDANPSGFYLTGLARHVNKALDELISKGKYSMD